MNTRKTEICYRKMRKKGKKANIVLDLDHNSAQKLLDEIRATPQYRDAFISGQDALLMCDNRSILIVVDTNRPDASGGPAAAGAPISLRR